MLSNVPPPKNKQNNNNNNINQKTNKQKTKQTSKQENRWSEGTARATWVILLTDKSSTDEQPIYNVFLDSWCQIRKQSKKELSTPTITQTVSLLPSWMKPIPFLKTFSTRNSLRNARKTHAEREWALSSILWKCCPKLKHPGLTVVNAATALAVCTFSDGTASLGTISEEMPLGAGPFARLVS